MGTFLRHFSSFRQKANVAMYACFTLIYVNTAFCGIRTPENYFIENVGQLQTTCGSPADSVKAYANIGNGRLFITAHSAYYSYLKDKKIVRVGFSLPNEFAATLQGEVPERMVRVSVGSNRNVTARTFKTVVFNRNQSLSQFLIQCTPSAIEMGLSGEILLENPALEIPLESIARKRVSTDGTKTSGSALPSSPSSGVKWVDEQGQVIFEETVSVNGEEISADDYAKTAFQSSSLHFQSIMNGFHSANRVRAAGEITIQLRSSTFLGGSGLDSVLCTTPINGGIILCGSTASSAFPCTAGVSQTSLKGSRDAWIARYDNTAKPVWSTYFGGNGEDFATGCAINGNSLVISGTTNSTDIATGGSFQSSFKGGTSDAFVAVFSLANGTKTSCTYIGGTEADEGRSVCFIPNGDIAIGGTSYSTDLPLKGHQPQLNGGADAFAVVLDPSLQTVRWGTYYGGRADEEGRGVAALDDGSLILVGNTSSPNSGLRIAENVTQGSTPPGGLQTSGFIARLSTSGSRLWGRYLGGDAFDTITCVMSNKNEIYVGGYTNSQSGGANNFISAGSAQPGSGSGINDGFISKLSADGLLTWGSFIGGSNDDRVYGISLTPTSDVITCGTTNSANFPIINSFQQSLGGGFDAFVSYVLKTGKEFGASSIIGGTGDDCAMGSSILPDRSVLVAGTTSSSSFPVSSATQPTFGGASDAFISLFEPLYTVDVNDDDNNTPQGIIFPVPTNSAISITAPSPLLESSTIRVFSSDGCEVANRSVFNSSITETVDVSHLPTGAYTIFWSNAVHSYCFRFIKHSE